MTPDVSIILICFNDAKRLPRALESLLDQTLANLEIIVVDDASTDETSSVIASYAARDARIRSIRLDTNSGGCSRPRNVGMEAAIAPWVMFCDSDDVMERHAAKTLLHAAEAADADVACGVVERVHLKTGEVQRWRADAHEPGVLSSIEERLELLADTVSVNKCYRRAFLQGQDIRFPEGILYEDQLFTFEVLALATRIAVVDDTVYWWTVDSVAEDASITQRRHELRNVRDRIAVNQLIDQSIATRSLQRLRAAKDEKFLRHDLYLHLIPLLDLDDDAARQVMDVLAPYCATVNPAAAEALRPGLRVALFHLLKGDLEHLRSALRALRWAASIDAPIDVIDGREVWACGHELGEGELGRDARWWLDVTDLRVARAPIAFLRPCHRVVEVGANLQLSGTTIDMTALGQPDSAALLLMAGERVLFKAPVDVTTEGRTWRWSTSGGWSAAVADAATSAHRGVVALELHFGAETTQQPVRMLEAPNLEMTVAGITVQVSQGEFGAVAWSRTSRHASARLRRWARRMAGAIARRLPARGIVLWSLDGRSAGDAMLELAGHLPQAHWMWERNPELLPGGGVDITSFRGGWTLGRARVVIVDGPMPTGMRTDAIVVRIQSDVPVLRVGQDTPQWDLMPPKQQIPAEVRRWNVLAVPSELAEERMADAMGFSGTRLVTGSLRGERAARISKDEARRQLGLSGDRAVVLWAPTTTSDVDPEAALQRDLGLLVDALGDDALILVRSRKKFRVPAPLRSCAKDVSLLGDAAVVLAASDVVLSDASPLMLDAVRLGVPVVVWSGRFGAIERESGYAVDPSDIGPVSDDLAVAVDLIRSAIAGAATPASEVLRDLAGDADGAERLATFLAQAQS